MLRPNRDASPAFVGSPAAVRLPAAEPSAEKARRPGWLRRWGRRLLMWVVAPYTLLLTLLAVFEESLVFPAGNWPQDQWEPAGISPENVAITSGDGVKLHGWFLPHPDPLAVVLYLHGNGGNVTHRAERLRFFQQHGAAVLIFDYRGYGRSEGSPDEAGVLLDARAARKWLAERTSVAETDIVLMGESLGGGIAVDLAAEDGARGLILESTFTSLPDTAAFHYPYVPVRWLMRTRLDSLSKIPRYAGPLLQSHGNQDEVIPLELGQRLFAAAPGPKEFLLLPGASHNRRASADWDLAIVRFLESL